MIDAAAGGYLLGADQAVAAQPGGAGQPADAAAEGEPGDAGVADEAAGDGEAVLLGGGVDVGPGGAAAAHRTTALDVDAHLAHRRQVDHQPVLDHGEAGEVVA